MKTLPSIVFGVLVAATSVAGADTVQAHTALLRGQVADAERSLRAVIASAPQDGYAHQLLCRVFYAQDLVEQAVSECEAAVAAAPNDTFSQMWLGRAYGQKARHANPLAAYNLAKKVRQAFERAVQSGPANTSAVSDLGEFYVAAPAIVGGGIEKARALSNSVELRAPAQAHRIRANIADSQKDLRTEEAELQKAVDAGHTPAAYIDLGMFYSTHGQQDSAVDALRTGIQRDSSHDATLVDAASILITMNRSLDLAEQALRAYLGSTAQTDDAPVFKVHLQLGRLLARRGNLPEARREYAFALALAPDFAPAREAAKGA